MILRQALERAGFNISESARSEITAAARARKKLRADLRAINRHIAELYDNPNSDNLLLIERAEAYRRRLYTINA